MRQFLAPILTRFSAWRQRIPRSLLLFAFLVLAAFTALGLIDKRLAGFSTPVHLAVLLLLSLALGVLPAWLLETRFPQRWAGWAKALLAAAGNLAGILLFVGVSAAVSFREIGPYYRWLYLPALFLFSLPTCFWQAALATASIPDLRYRPLVFDSLKEVLAEMRFAEDEHKGIKWVFEEGFSEVDASGEYILRTHTPKKVEELQLGLLFKGALSLHNHNLQPRHPILFQLADGLAGWEFYHAPHWWRPGRRRALDPDRTLRRNRLRFRRLPEEEWQSLASTSRLSPKFRVATIYVRRSSGHRREASPPEGQERYYWSGPVALTAGRATDH